MGAVTMCKEEEGPCSDDSQCSAASVCLKNNCPWDSSKDCCGGRYTKVTSGASCEASGFGRITSGLECQTAPQELGLSFRWRGTVDAPDGPPGCYLRFDGDLWYNVNEQSTVPCTSQSYCVCKTVAVVTRVIYSGLPTRGHNPGTITVQPGVKYTVNVEILR